MRHVLALLAAGASLALAAPTLAQAPAATAIVNVCVLPMTAGAGQVCGQTVLVEEGRIARIAPVGAVAVPATATRIEGRGRWLMPGLADMHTHVENDGLFRLILGDPAIPSGAVDAEDIFIPYLANGVLQIANLAATPESIRQRDQLESGQVVGPHMALAAMIDGERPIWPIGMSRSAATPEAGRRAVQAVKAEGYDFIKVYSGLSSSTFDAILDQAARDGLKVLGHIPARSEARPEAYLKPGLSMVVHAEEYAYQVGTSEEAIPRLVDLARASGVWLAPTLTLNQRILEQAEASGAAASGAETAYLHPLTRRFWTERNTYVGRPGLADMMRRVTGFNAKLVQAFDAAGIPVVAGTDALVPGVAPGFSLHDELEALQGAGLAPDRVLAGATRLSVEWLGVAADRGTVAVGKRADLILLDADPFLDVRNTRRIAYVIRDGRVFSRAELDAMMAGLAERYRPREAQAAAAP